MASIRVSKVPLLEHHQTFIFTFYISLALPKHIHPTPPHLPSQSCLLQPPFYLSSLQPASQLPTPTGGQLTPHPATVATHPPAHPPVHPAAHPPAQSAPSSKKATTSGRSPSFPPVSSTALTTTPSASTLAPPTKALSTSSAAPTLKATMCLRNPRTIAAEPIRLSALRSRELA
jgi:hypothetical protein